MTHTDDYTYVYQLKDTYNSIYLTMDNKKITEIKNVLLD